MRIRLAPMSVTLDDLNCSKFEFSVNFMSLRDFTHLGGSSG